MNDCDPFGASDRLDQCECYMRTLSVLTVTISSSEVEFEATISGLEIEFEKLILK